MKPDDPKTDPSTGAAIPPPADDAGAVPKRGRRIIRRDNVPHPRSAEQQPARGRGAGERRPPSAAKRGGKPWAMAPAELEAAIDALTDGNHTRFARVCGVHDRTVRSWLAGHPDVPKVVQVLVAALRRLPEEARQEIVGEAGAIE